ncbi:arginine--tRNA ligase [Campylobacter sp. 19-13652]|uniref:arginine--tRNA ligase n=1 Tax=Campylobacter sp. 19-13652 TaxID=2840180 RepID=UPI001C78FDA2|nr:arginine--tRNA ligase [Campylobacter sp. 19-13652]BCX79733.1 arginine--tRNA ligase [Campylobacter sp. 19-13652]
MKQVVVSNIAKLLARDVVIEKPKDKNLAHYATPLAFSLAKELKKSPAVIANELVEKFDGCEIFSATAVNGYINFKLSGDFLDDLASEALKNSDEFARFGRVASSFNKDELSPNKANQAKNSLLLEYISANPTGPLHIGHVRGAVYGDTLARVGRHLGFDIKTEYYINDAGNQIDLLGLSIRLAAREVLFGESVQYPEKYYRGEYIIDIARAALDKFGKGIFDENENARLADFGKDFVLEIIKKDLADAGIFIDSWASERALYSQLEPTLKKLEKSGEVYVKDGATYIASSKLGDDSDRVVVRDDGRPTYLAGDIIYHEDKFKQNYAKYMNIWGADHHGYIARLKAAIHFLGYDENRLDIVLMQMVSLLKDGKPFKMSKRAGNSVLMSDILAEIGADALRYIFISKANTSSLEFDIDELKKQDNSNPVFYINYAHARIHQLFAKANKSVDDVKGANISSLNDAAKNLLFEALTLAEVLNDAYSSYQLHKLPDYLKTLAASFHKFYNENKIVGSDDEDAFLKVLAVVALSIKTGLNLIGIEAKKIMSV